MMKIARHVSRISVLVAAMLGAVITHGRADAFKIVDQGRSWTTTARNAFYKTDQGAQMIPLAWFRALKHPDGTSFLADSLARYGYLPNKDPSNPSGLPVGFTSADTPQGAIAGMTCSACHTRQIDVGTEAYRIDGGPALADFETFLGDLDQAVVDVLADKAKFTAFANDVLGPNPSADAVAILNADVTVWSVRFHTLIDRSLPTERRWGPARLDAVSMIFNRLTGLDLGPAPTYLIPDNIVKADAPARYPFLWNAPKQDFTQWPGFSQNGNDFFALSRNLGEVYGVFGTFHPRETKGSVALFNRNYIVDNSANFAGLETLEGLIKRLAPPKWTWPVDATLVARGKQLYEAANTEDGKGGCAGCHGIRTGAIRLPNLFTWRTPIQNVKTDQREWHVLTRYAASGSMEGASIPAVVPTILDRDLAITILKASVVGAIGEYEAWKISGDLSLQSRLGAGTLMNTTAGAMISISPAGAPAPQASLPTILASQSATTPLSQMDAAFHLPGDPAGTTAAGPSAADAGTNAYESRVLEGIWAAAPYLHNGSVPTLADLLKPAAQRTRDFKVGPAYDIVNVGLATDQPKSTFVLHTTGCDDVASGDSNCGHEYGTQLPDDDKKALLEYLKTL